MQQDIAKKVADTILAQLKTGVAPWRKPWSGNNLSGKVSLPMRSIGQPYQGINVLLLWCEAMAHDYQSPFWCTFKQAQEYGAFVRKGEKGTTVVYADRFTKKEEGGNGEEVERSIPFLKSYTVFNADQIDGLPEHFYARPANVIDPAQRIAAADEFFKATGAIVRHGGNKCFYVPSQDIVQMVPFEAFNSPQDYYATLSHEVVGHWTGHETRLNRDLTGKFKTASYAYEEMLAEIASAMTCAELGLEPTVSENHASYIATWIKLLTDHPKAIISAASAAQASLKFVQGLQPTKAEKLEAA